MSDVDQILLNARQSEDPDQLAEALMQHANTLIEKGQVAAARLELDEAAEIHRQQGRVYDEARCTQLAATLCRLEGHMDEARLRAKRAGELAGPGTPIAVSVATEMAEIAMAEGKAPEAEQAYTRALEEGQSAGLNETARSSLLRKRAIARVKQAQYQEAAQDLALSHELLLGAGDPATALRTLVEQATALQQGGYVQEAESLRQAAMGVAEESGDHHVMADLYLLEATQAVENRQVEIALAAAQKARQHALQAVAPISYVSASLTISDLSEVRGDHRDAYEALATGWATLGDLLGSQVAKSTFEPKLLALRQRWGTATFYKIKSEYETRRKAG